MTLAKSELLQVIGILCGLENKKEKGILFEVIIELSDSFECRMC